MADNVPEEVRDVCDRYGEQVISNLLASGFAPSTEDLRSVFLNEMRRNDARDWLTEASDVREFKERWVSGRDLVLEIVVIALIGWEIALSIRADTNQATNFSAQQNVLTDMQKSTKDTADQLALLKSTTEEMNRGVERNAEAAEASSKTAAKSLVVSERAYLTITSVSTEPKAGEKLRVTNSLVNSGKTPAIEVKAKAWIATTGKEMAVEDAYKRVVAGVALDDKMSSNQILGPTQTSQQIVESAMPLSNEDFTAINNGSLVWYVFVELRYDDTFGPHHTALACNRYYPERKTLVLCSTLNKAD